MTAFHLNLRSAPDPDKKNVIATLPQGTEVTKVREAEMAGWIEVDTTIAGQAIHGFLNGAHVAPAGTTSFPAVTAAAGEPKEADLGPSEKAKRSSTGARANSVGEPDRPGRPSTEGAGKAAGIVKILDWLDVGDTDKHLRWKGVGGKTFCNVYVYDVCALAGVYIPRVWWTSKALVQLSKGATIKAIYGETVMEMRANYIFNWLVEYGEDFGWERVFDLDALQDGANAGRIGVVCAQRKDMETPGHIQIAAPEHGSHKAKRSGSKVVQPLQSNAGSENFTFGHLSANWYQASKYKQHGFWLADVG
ncbi:SH3 domain-containing protein [Roseomonas sp. USHLN139]|uniref:SH3 domain-containing protein n=1 Tax=Roseomonas sp. USHLN139 TaxID=3081298 RepID=UPI003B02797E